MFLFSRLDPLTPSFPMETQKETAEMYVRRLIKPILEGVAKETPPNLMLVGSAPISKGYIFWQPHNYRLYFDYDPKTYQPHNLPNRSVIVKQFNKGSEWHIRTENIKDFSFNVKKKQILVRNFKDSGRWYAVEAAETAAAEMQRIVEQKDKECAIALKQFIEQFGGKSEFKVLNRYSEDKIKGDKAIDSVPQAMRFYNEAGKKVYAENFEFYGAENASTYIKNRALDRTVGDDVRDLKEQFKATLTPLLPVLTQLTDQIKLHLAVQEKTAQFLELANASLQRPSPLALLKTRVRSAEDVIINQDLVRQLSKDDLILFEHWLFEVGT